MTSQLGNSINPNSYAGTEWFGGDSKEHYAHNLKNHKAKLEQYGWIDAAITYDFNEHGFRADPFDTGDSIVFLGASDVIGVGLPLENVCSYMVSKELGLRHYNLGMNGASFDSVFRISYHWLPILRPKIIVLSPPPIVRLELITQLYGKRCELQLNPYIWDSHFHKPVLSGAEDFYKIWTATDYNFNLNQDRNTLAIQQIADSVGAKFITMNSAFTRWQDTDLARDLIHNGRHDNQLMADLILSKV